MQDSNDFAAAILALDGEPSWWTKLKVESRLLVLFIYRSWDPRTEEKVAELLLKGEPFGEEELRNLLSHKEEFPDPSGMSIFYYPSSKPSLRAALKEFFCARPPNEKPPEPVSFEEPGYLKKGQADV